MRENLLNDEDERIKIIQEDLENWNKLGEKMHADYLGLLVDLNGQRREMLKFVGTIAAGAAALAPQLLDSVKQVQFFYLGIGFFCLVVIVSITYVLSIIENDANDLAVDLKKKNEMLDRLREPKRNFLNNGDYSVDAFIKALSVGATDELSKISKEIENNRLKGNGWYRPMDYAGEFTVLFFISGIVFVILSLTDICVSWRDLLWVFLGVFVGINFISSFPRKIFWIFGSPIDLIKSLIRWIFRR